MKIVILGGGYAGFSAAVALPSVAAEVVLVDSHSYHHLSQASRRAPGTPLQR